MLYVCMSHVLQGTFRYLQGSMLQLYIEHLWQERFVLLKPHGFSALEIPWIRSYPSFESMEHRAANGKDTCMPKSA